jgi:hypothetical protein
MPKGAKAARVAVKGRTILYPEGHVLVLRQKGENPARFGKVFVGEQEVTLDPAKADPMDLYNVVSMIAKVDAVLAAHEAHMARVVKQNPSFDPKKHRAPKVMGFYADWKKTSKE